MNLKEIIEQVEKFIPLKNRKNFYKNIQNLTIEYVGIKDLDCEYNETQNENIGEYDYETNTIIINLNAINNAVATSQHKEESYRELLKHTVIHELLHMASTCYKKNKPIYNGFGDIIIGKYEKTVEHQGLTEGYTELLTSIIEKRNIEFLKNNPYKIQMMFSKQIEILIGKENMEEAYFNDSNIKLIHRKLKNINSALAPIELLELISYVLEQQKLGFIPYDEINFIQQQLIELFKRKMLNNKLSLKEVCEFEQYIVDDNIYDLEQRTSKVYKK